MFIKACKSIKNGKTYIHYQIAHSYREDGKIKHKLIANLGGLSDRDVDSLIRGLKKIKQKPICVEDAQLRHKKIISFAEIAVLEHLWQQLGISGIIASCAGKSLQNVEWDIAVYLKLMSFCRLLHPGSELKLAEEFAGLYFPELRVLEYHKLLRSLSYAIRIKDEVEQALFARQKDLFHLQVDIVFYDITSTYFEAEGPPIAKKGYSRDKRADRNQVLIALVVTKEGFPIGHEVLEGNRLDKSTVKAALDALKERFAIDSCIFVGDRGMVTEENLAYVQEQGYRYIVALRRRRLYETAEVLEEDLGKYGEMVDYDLDGNEKRLKYLEVKEAGVRYIVCHNNERASGDLSKLERRVEKLSEQMEEISKSRRAADQLIKRVGRIYHAGRFYEYGLDKEKRFFYRFKEDTYAYEKLICGKYVLKTNEQRLSCEEIIRAYKTLGRIEEAFKDMKDFLEVRPIFHRTEDNVRGHIFVAVLAYLLEKALESYFVKRGKCRITARRILEHLSKVKLVVSELNGHIFGKLTENTPEVKAILKKIGLKSFQDTYYLEHKKVTIPATAAKKLAKYDICSR